MVEGESVGCVGVCVVVVGSAVGASCVGCFGLCFGGGLESAVVVVAFAVADVVGHWWFYLSTSSLGLLLSVRVPAGK